MNPFLIACLSSWVVLHAAGAATASRPNFLVLLCDDLGWGDLACYGHPRIRTPHLDGLAKQGVRFTSYYIRNGQPAGSLEGYSCRIAAREAIGWLERQRARRPDQPFFLYVPFHEPHEPVASPPELVARHRGQARNENEAQYFANVENLDAAVGELLAALDRLRLTENTVVFFSSDNGPETLHRYAGAQRSYGSPGPLRGMKLWTTEGGCRVPGILRWPGRVQAGQVSDEPVSSLDLLPTFCALGRAAVPRGLKLDGADLRPVFNGEPVKRDQPLFWVYFRALNDQRAALRDGPWKLLAKLDHGKLPELSAKLETLYRELTATMHVWPDTE